MGMTEEREASRADKCWMGFSYLLHVCHPLAHLSRYCLRECAHLAKKLGEEMRAQMSERERWRSV